MTNLTADDDNNPRFEYIEVTPEMAAEWLANNTHNRNMRERVVNSYASDMTAGDWQWNGETIKFAADGTLLDGQHRLRAIVASGVSVWMLVIYGLHARSQETVDGGTRRSFADVLALRGETNTRALAAILRQVCIWEHGDRNNKASRFVPTNAQLIATLNRHPWIRDGVPLAQRTRRACGLPSAVAGLLWWMFVQIDGEDANGFFETLNAGENIAKGDPIYTLRRALTDPKTIKSQRYLTAISIKAWNAYRAGDSAHYLRFRAGGANPESFPEPK